MSHGYTLHNNSFIKNMKHDNSNFTRMAGVCEPGKSNYKPKEKTMKFKLFLIGCFFLNFILSCDNIEDKNNSNEIPPIIGFKNRAEFDSICNAINEEVQKKILNGNVEIVFKDTFHLNNDFLIFENVLQNLTNLRPNVKYQLDFEECYKAKMDSVIISKYGCNYKDSVIKVAYQITDSIIKFKR